jgi:hypothetical protein
MRPSWLLLSLVACGKDDDTTPTEPEDTDTTPEDTDVPPPPPPGPDLVITDPNDYTLSVQWALSEVEILDAFDVTVDWTNLTTDAWGAPFEVTQTDKILLLDVLAAPDEVPALLSSDDFGTDLSAVWEADATGKSFVKVSELKSGTTEFDPAAFLLENPNRSWVAALANEVDGHYDLLAALILVPTDPGGIAKASFVDGGSSVTWSADIAGTPLVTAEDWEQYSLDWKNLVYDAFGRVYDETRINKLFLASFDESVADLDDDVWHLESLANGWWTMDILNEDDGLPEIAHDENGGTFPGFSVGQTWLVGTQCTTADCFTRFPAWLVEVQVVPR